MIKVIGGALWQWDTGRKVQIIARGGYTISGVQFFNGTTENALRGILLADNTAEIPNEFMQTANNLTVYAVMEHKNGERTIESVVLGVRKRKKPDDYIYTPTDVLTSEAVIVTNIGATGDGKIDDSEAIQKALNNYSTVIIPAGTYRVKGLTITRSNVKVVGENATLQITDDCDLTGYSKEPNGIYIKSTDPANPVSNVEISGIHFDGNASHFFANGADTVDKFDSNCIVMANAENVTVHHCTFNNYKSRGIGSGVDKYDTEEVDHYGVHGLHVYDCEFNNDKLPYKVVEITDSTPAGGKNGDYKPDNGTYHIMPHTNAIQILQSGGKAYDSDIVIERCTVHKSPNYGFMFYPSTHRITVRDCTIKNCGLYTSEEADVYGGGGHIDYGYYRRPVTGDDKADHSDGSCIKLNTVRDVLIDNNDLHGAKASNITIHTAQKKTYDELGKVWANLKWLPTKNVVICNNRIYGGADQRRTGNGINVEAGEDIKIVGNTIVDQIGVAENHAVWGSAVKFSKPTAITSNVSCLISGNTINNCSNGMVLFVAQVTDNIITETSAAMYFSTNSARAAESIIVRGNKISRTATNYTVCIDIRNAVNAIVSENMITNYSRGLQLYGSSKYITVGGNKYIDCSRPIVATIDDKTLVDGGTSSKHDNVNIYGNSFAKTDGESLIPQTNYTIVWENTNALQDDGTNATGAFVPANSKIDFVPVTRA